MSVVARRTELLGSASRPAKGWLAGPEVPRPGLDRVPRTDTLRACSPVVRVKADPRQEKLAASTVHLARTSRQRTWPRLWDEPAR